MTDPSTRLMTAKDLAKRWQVPESQVYRLAREGRIPAVRLGRYWRFRLDLIEQWETPQRPTNPLFTGGPIKGGPED